MHAILLPLVLLILPLVAEARTSKTVAREAIVREVIDGDTVSVVLDGGMRSVRLLYIDAMETGPNAKMTRDLAELSKKGIVVKKKDVLALGKLAKIYLQSLIKKGDRIFLESGSGGKKDRYGRLLVVLRDRKDANVNLIMVREGYARTYFLGKVPDSVKAPYLDAENAARRECRVIWNYIR